MGGGCCLKAECVGGVGGVGCGLMAVALRLDSVCADVLADGGRKSGCGASRRGSGSEQGSGRHGGASGFGLSVNLLTVFMRNFTKNTNTVPTQY